MLTARWQPYSIRGHPSSDELFPRISAFYSLKHLSESSAVASG